MVTKRNTHQFSSTDAQWKGELKPKGTFELTLQAVPHIWGVQACRKMNSTRLRLCTTCCAAFGGVSAFRHLMAILNRSFSENPCFLWQYALTMAISNNKENLAPWDARKDIFPMLQLSLTLVYSEPRCIWLRKNYFRQRRPLTSVFIAGTDTVF